MTYLKCHGPDWYARTPLRDATAVLVPVPVCRPYTDQMASAAGNLTVS